ncbi:MAG: radical SAM protein [Bacteroidales bacterium]|nr:radical SAM protein [Candidatus Cacconaster merdequi]
MALRFDHIVFGPIKSRRLGNSLGINLLPRNGKVCTFDCIYCECGWNADGREDTSLPGFNEVCASLEEGIARCSKEGVSIDTITFSGNGEPTLHPDFPAIIDRTLELRDRYYPQAKVSVLSNATQLGREGIKEALSKVDNPILKIDSASEDFARLVDRPVSGHYSVSSVEKELEWFQGDFILQTMFLRGKDGLQEIDSTEPALVREWTELVLRLRPREVMMYTLDRVPPLKTLGKVTVGEMEAIAAPLVAAGITVQIKG